MAKNKRKKENLEPKEEIEKTTEPLEETEAETAKVETEGSELSTRLCELESEKEALQDRFLRLQAEYENYRKRSSSELSRRYEDAIVDVATSWLDVLDNLDRALEACEKVESEEAKQLAQGIELVKRQADETMQKFGITEIAGVGTSFDPCWHEALHHISDENLGENEIAQVFKKGYQKGERVLRHAQVQVAN